MIIKRSFPPRLFHRPRPPTPRHREPHHTMRRAAGHLDGTPAGQGLPDRTGSWRWAAGYHVPREAGRLAAAVSDPYWGLGFKQCSLYPIMRVLRRLLLFPSLGRQNTAIKTESQVFDLVDFSSVVRASCSLSGVLA